MLHHERTSEPFAKHFHDKYGDHHDLPPYWMLVNVMDFGIVVTLDKGSRVPVRKLIASELGISTRVLDSWLVTVNTVRNICAHHGHLWNRIIGNPPMAMCASYKTLNGTLMEQVRFGFEHGFARRDHIVAAPFQTATSRTP